MWQEDVTLSFICFTVREIWGVSVGSFSKIPTKCGLAGESRLTHVSKAALERPR